MQCKLKKQTLVSYEYKTDSPKRDKIMRILKTFLLGDIDNLTSVKLSKEYTLKCWNSK